MKLLIICAVLCGSFLAAAAAAPESISDRIRALEVQYRAALGDGVTLLPDDAKVKLLAASTVENFVHYQGMVPAGVGADNPDFLRIAAARTLVFNMLNDIAAEDQIAPGADFLKKKYEDLGALVDAICALYGQIQP